MNLPIKPKAKCPPALSEKLLSWCLPEELKDPILGDLAEEYLTKQSHTSLQANYWYNRQALRTSLQFITKTRRGFIMFILSILVFSAAIIMAMVMSGHYTMFINVPSLLIVIPPALLITFACSSKQTVKQAFHFTFSERVDFDKGELLCAKKVFNLLGNMNMLMGWIGLVIGAIAIASNIEPEVFSIAIGPALAVCFLTVFYALIVKALCYAAEAKIQFKLISQTQ
jgi:chemotaxis protein MotA